MSGFNACRQAIEERLSTLWTTTPIRYQNAPFQETANPYVALFILDGDGEQISLGTPALRRWAGVIMLQVFVPEDTGHAQARSYADSLGALFDRAQFSVNGSGTIRCRMPSMTPSETHEGWYQVTVAIPFIRDKQY